ncbi:Endonuclease/exonuclease/phosphatase [Anaeromyxobacter dehalogenans 2CP-1]|uniref:Endonuclease/exonuclease/phosphatase n=2 Tax=Anaeromyxobacter dehalogenans TaxID=161493 RepID=B8J907_ANAD2|nr:Endonuclease/exonuclease/phosphatase [Anaeromyxobacter dehalogenans 2CP-1]
MSRTRLAVLALALSPLVLVACSNGDGSSAAASDAVRAPPAAGSPSAHGAGMDPHSMAGGKKILGVTTRNLYLGADLGPVMAAATPAAFVAATTAVWVTVQANDFHVRAEAIADELAATRPGLVGLQEAYLWRVQDPGDFLAGGTTPATTVAYDYVQDLLDALAARDLHYVVAAEVTLFDFEAPVATGQDVRMTDRGVILARSDLATALPTGGVYATLLPVTVLGNPVQVKRGWVSVDARYRGEWLRFVSTHLEAYHAGVRTAQAAELAGALAAETRPVVLVGDLNSQPGTEGEAVLAAAGFSDVWAAVNGDAPGLTCCFPEDLRIGPGDPGFADLSTRIDYVLVRGPVEPWSAEVVGETADERVGGLWPSDHAGVAAEVRVTDGRHAGE